MYRRREPPSIDTPPRLNGHPSPLTIFSEHATFFYYIARMKFGKKTRITHEGKLFLHI